MAGYKKKVDFLESEEGIAIKQALQKMAADSAYNTKASYSADAERFPDGSMSFVDKHMDYLRRHPATDPQQYISNLRLMTRVR